MEKTWAEELIGDSAPKWVAELIDEEFAKRDAERVAAQRQLAMVEGQRQGAVLVIQQLEARITTAQKLLETSIEADEDSAVWFDIVKFLRETERPLKACTHGTKPGFICLRCDEEGRDALSE